jgi:hypothetical protein
MCDRTRSQSQVPKVLPLRGNILGIGAGEIGLCCICNGCAVFPGTRDLSKEIKIFLEDMSTPPSDCYCRSTSVPVQRESVLATSEDVDWIDARWRILEIVSRAQTQFVLVSERHPTHFISGQSLYMIPRNIFSGLLWLQCHHRALMVPPPTNETLLLLNPTQFRLVRALM